MRELIFARSTLKRNLARYGANYEFFRHEKNNFNEDTDVIGWRKPIKGIFHKVTSYINVQIDTGAKLQKKEIPYILCLYEDSNGLQMDDKVIINGLTYKVNGIDNVSQQNQISDISLEVIL